MRKFLKIAASVFAAALMAAFLMAGCAGKDGAAGPAAADGKDGNDASATCTQCHANNQTIVSKEQQMEPTKHVTGYSFEARYGERPTCQPCHNGLTATLHFAGDSATQYAIGRGILDTNLLYNYTNINCRVCHQIHTNYDSTDYRLTSTATVPARRIPGYTWPNIGKGNLCLTCHDYRDRPVMDTAVHGDSAWINSTRFGAHVSTQNGMYFGVGGYEDPDYVSLKQSGNHPSMITDGCVACHVSASNGMAHNFTPQVKSCNAVGCHATKPMSRTAKVVKDPTGLAVGAHKTYGDDTTWYYTTDESSIEVQKLLNEARDSLIAKRLLKLDGEDHYYGHSGNQPTNVGWTRSATVATITYTNHRLVAGQNIRVTSVLDSVGTTKVDTAAIKYGVKVVASVIDSNTFTIACLDAGATSNYGKVTYYPQVTRQWAGLLQNFRFVDYDLSKGIHNTKYAKYLLVSGLKGIGVTRDLTSLLN